MYIPTISTKAIIIYNDCAFTANPINKLSPNIKFDIIDSAGEWKKITTEDGISGWIFPYIDGIYLLEKAKDTLPKDIRIGNLIVINSKDAFIKDYYGHILTIKNGYTPIIFQVESIVLNPVRVEFKNNDKTFSFEINKVIKYDPNNSKDLNGIKLTLFADDSSTATTDNGTTVTVTANTSAGETQKNADAKADNDSELKKIISQISDITKNLDQSNDNVIAQNLTQLQVDSLQGVFGMPYQFLPIADMRLPGASDDFHAFGSKYAEKIIARMPLLIMTPGVAKFMAKYSNKDRTSIIESLFGTESSNSSKRLDKILSDSGQYYNFYADWVSYYKYVNPLCRIASVLMKINNKTIPDQDGKQVKLGEYNWARVANDKFRSSFAYKGGSAYYLNTDSQVSETYSNETTKTQLADKINSVSDKVRELQFLMGNVSAAGIGPISSKTQVENMQADANKKNNNSWFSNVFSGLSGPSSNNILGSIANGMGEVVQGSKMRFPELWAESQFSKDYSISIKLMSPDCDQLSLYLNIIVPLIHLMCLAAPRSTGVNAYNSPFLVRAFYRGFFNINMGMITSMNITKGGEGRWSYSNIPTEVDVSITIKDLYDIMAISMNNADNFNMDVSILSNNTLMDYISNAVGVNINEIDVIRTITLYKVITAGKVNDVFPNLGESLDRWVYNKLIQFFK